MAATTGRTDVGARSAERLTTETKAAPKTTEFMAFIVIVAGILISALLIKGGDTDGTDEFVAKQAWLYVSIVTAGYLISRGLAKSGSREPYWGGGSNELRDRDGR
ncbi:MAG: hypothetical protein JWM73_389 [Solirubrobacterales bacterium]|jgi:hypothetical protein|nr:hypothetical protein [Solirubrobacterales bacterium]